MFTPSVSEFNEFEPRLKSAKYWFQLSHNRTYKETNRDYYFIIMDIQQMNQRRFFNV